eukprot:PhM_4_TR17394/c0_g1_i13/m.90046
MYGQRNQRSDSNKIVVRGLPSGVDQREVQAYFARIGDVNDFFMKDTGRDTFGFVGFESAEAYEAALGHDGAAFGSCTLRIEPKNAGYAATRGGFGGGRQRKIGTNKAK